jgi:hypothetical protein
MGCLSLRVGISVYAYVRRMVLLFADAEILRRPSSYLLELAVHSTYVPDRLLVMIRSASIQTLDPTNSMYSCFDLRGLFILPSLLQELTSPVRWVKYWSMQMDSTES